MRTSNEPKRWAIVGTVAAILLIVWTTALGTSPCPATLSHHLRLRVKVSGQVPSGCKIRPDRKRYANQQQRKK